MNDHVATIPLYDMHVIYVLNPTETGANKYILIRPRARQAWEVLAIRIANDDGAARDFTLQYYDGTTYVTISSAVTIANGVKDSFRPINTPNMYLDYPLYLNYDVYLKVLVDTVTTMANIEAWVVSKEYPQISNN